MLISRCLIFVGLCGFASAAFPADEIDWNRARELHRKFTSGQMLTAEEQADYERARTERARRQGLERPQGRIVTQVGRPEPKPSTGLVPLTDMTASDRYKGEDAGLYGNGRNKPPEEHLQAALGQAKRVQPLDPKCRPSPDGKIALISVGMSNTTQEFSEFVRLGSRDSDKSSQVVIVDGAQGGMDARSWAEPDRSRNPWDVLDARLRQAGVTPEQVQVVWLKQARRNPASLGEYPRHVEELAGHVETILHGLKERFPNLRIAYLSSRIYAGYATTPLNPEPYAYESAFAVRRLIQRQINGEPSLYHDSAKGKAKAPLLLWGPYLWADGEQGRKFDDLVWQREDLAGDGTHPSPSGQRKVARRLLRFFKTDPTAEGWFLKPRSQPQE